MTRARLPTSALCLGLAVTFACSTPPPPPKTAESPEFIDGVRQRPLTPEEVTEQIREGLTKFEDCYRRERLNFTFPTLSSYTFRFQVPADGSKNRIGVVEETQPGQQALRLCLADALRSIRFPAHTGKTITIDVPIAAPK